jgi:hypothetical protein
MSSTDPIEAMARAIHQERQSAGFGGKATWEYEPADIRAIHLQTARGGLAALRQWLEAEGLVVVPRDSTMQMCQQGDCTTAMAFEGGYQCEAEAVWDRMISAAPDALRAEGE